MRCLIEIGKAAWVDPEAIQAIEWSTVYDCPKCLMSSGHVIYAFKFKDSVSSEAGTNALLDKIREAASVVSGEVAS